MCLRLETRNEMKIKELKSKVKTPPVAHQLCRRRVQLYASFKNIGVDSLKDLLEGAKVWRKDWIRQVRADLDNHGLKTKCDQDNWLQNPTTKLKFTDGGDFEANAIGKRSQTVQCANENCGRMFHNKKEMYRHLREDHSESSVQTSASEIENKGTERTVTIKGIERTVEITQLHSDGGSKKSKFDCPLSDCNKTYVYVSGWTKCMQNCHPHVKLISASESTVWAPQLSRQPFASNRDTSTGDEVLKCPLCSYRYSVRKSMINHCYVKHRYSWVKARTMRKPPSNVGVFPVHTINRQNCADCSVMTTTATSER